MCFVGNKFYLKRLYLLCSIIVGKNIKTETLVECACFGFVAVTLVECACIGVDQVTGKVVESVCTGELKEITWYVFVLFFFSMFVGRTASYKRMWNVMFLIHVCMNLDVFCSTFVGNGVYLKLLWNVLVLVLFHFCGNIGQCKRSRNVNIFVLYHNPDTQS